MNKTFLIIPVMALALSACGGGGGDTPPPGTGGPGPSPVTTVPASASNSVGGLLDYLQLLAQAVSDMLEPASLQGFTPATSETEEPRPLK